MARAKVDEVLVSARYEQLVAAALDRASFEAVVDDITEDDALRAVDVIEIAHRYIGGGLRPKSKRAALTALMTRFTERVRAEGKSKIAAGMRPW